MYANQALLSDFLRSSEGINDVKLDGGGGGGGGGEYWALVNKNNPLYGNKNS